MQVILSSTRMLLDLCCDPVGLDSREVCARVASGGAKEMNQAVAAAREAFPQWAGSSEACGYGF